MSSAHTTTDPAAREIREELSELRRTVESLRKSLQAALGGRSRIILEVGRPRPFLGQPVTLVARVTDAAGGAPRPGVAVTFTASWGRLRTAEGYLLREGAALTTRTYADGTARVTLLPPTEEELTSRQQDALVAALGNLDPEAAAPGDVPEGLEELVRQYRWEANEPFRQAVDLFFREFRGERDRINPHDSLARWRWFESTVLAFVESAEEATAVEASAVRSLRFRDWLDPWLETHLRLARSEGRLEKDLNRVVKRRREDPSGLLSGIYQGVQRFVEDQKGQVGRFIGEKVAETSIREFATAGLQEIPREGRVRVADNLHTVSRTVGDAGIRVFTGLSQVQTEAREEARSRVATLDAGKIEGLAGRLGQVETGLRTKVDSDTLTDLQTRLEGRIDTRIDRTTLDQELETLVSRQDFDTFRTETDSRLATKIDQTRFDQELAAKADLSSLTDLRVDLEQRIDTRIDRTTLDQELETLVTRQDFESFRLETNNQLETKVDQTRFDRELDTKVDLGTFDRFKSTNDRLLASKVDTESFDTLKTNVDSNFTSLENRVRGFRVVNPIIRPGGPFRRGD